MEIPGRHIELLRITTPDTGETARFSVEGILNPRGLTWDGQYFWVNDFSLLKIFKFHVEGDQVVRALGGPEGIRDRNPG